LNRLARRRVKNGERPTMKKALCLLFILAAALPARAQEKADIPDPECDGGTFELVKCLEETAAKWDKRLNEAYRETLKEGPKEQQAQLRAAQRLWVQFRDANCKYYGLSEGSIRHVLWATCMFDMTKARAKELEAAPGN
jgi:uncharacterized protein YecT (DUF1311 family)